METVKIVLKTTRTVSDPSSFPYGHDRNVRVEECLSSHGISLQADDNGVVALTAEEAKQVSRLLAALGNGAL